MLKRKIDQYLIDWKNNSDKKPLIITGARQVGKTTSVENFGKSYKSFIEINFVTMPQYKTIFKNGYDVNNVIKEMSLLNPNFKFIPNDTLILFDEIQEYPDAATSLKPFSIDGRFDVICSGSLLGVYYKKITSIPVGFKEEYKMISLDFEEFLWAYGYNESQIEDIFNYMKELKPLPEAYINKLSQLYKEYLFVGGMPEVVNTFIKENVFTNVFNIQKRIYKDYEDDIIKYVIGLETSRVKNIYRHISTQLSKDNHKYQITKLGHGARLRDYVGAEEWLIDAGIINISYNLDNLTLPLSSNENSSCFRMYFADHSLFIANLDEESKDDLIINNNYDIYNGALYESLISEALIKAGYETYFYKSEDATIELDFVIRVKNEIVPIEVKRNRGRSKSLNIIMLGNYGIHYAVKLMNSNIGFNNNIFTFPYFLSFLLKRFFKETNYISW